MKIASLILSFLFTAISIWAQEPEPLKCPVIRITSTVNGPKEKLPDGATAKFTAILEPKKPEDQLKYNWTLSSGKIVSGQGTDTVQVERQIHYVTATVHIDGFRTDGMCLQAASETVWWDVEPTAEKMKVLSGEKFEPTTYDAGFLGNVPIGGSGLRNIVPLASACTAGALLLSFVLSSSGSPLAIAAGHAQRVHPRLCGHTTVNQRCEEQR